jgi:hypothetical protein
MPDRPDPDEDRLPRPALGYVVALATLAALFAGRVAAQAIQRWLPLPFLPPAAAFQGSALPYAILLPAQIAIIALMLRTVRGVRGGAMPPRARTGRALTAAGGIYIGTMLARLAIGVALPDSPGWFHSQISIAFHFVLALFVLVLAAWHARTPPRSANPGTP